MILNIFYCKYNVSIIGEMAKGRALFVLSFIFGTSIIIYLGSSPEDTKLRLYDRNIHELDKFVFNALGQFSKTIIVYQQKVSTSIIPKASYHNLITLDATSRLYFIQLQNLSNCKTVFFTVNRKVFQNMLSQRLYGIHSNNCSVFFPYSVGNNDFLKLNCTEQATYQHINTDNGLLLHTNTFYDIQSGYFNNNLESKSHKVNNSDELTLGFMHIIKDVYMATNGDVMTGNTYISILRCKKAKHSVFDFEIPVHDKVFL